MHFSQRRAGWNLLVSAWRSRGPDRGWRRRRRWPVTASLTLLAYLGATFSPLVAAAQEADTITDAERIGGGSLSSRTDRAGATAVGDGPAPTAVVTPTSDRGDGAPADGPPVDTQPGEPETGEPAEDDIANEPAVPNPNVVAQALPSGGDKSGVTAQAISVPDGSGSIQGMGESFSAQLSTGIATFSVPFALPKARGGVQPSLGLSYSSGGGNGPAGQGWSVGVPFIARQTDRGLPKYDDRATWHPEQDRFVFNGGQELVPICTVGASLSCSGALLADAATGEPAEVMPAWSSGWQYFRPRVEGSFLRFFWSPDHLTWVVQDKSGTTMEMGVPQPANGPAPGGASAAGTAALERNPTRPGEIYSWHLSRQYDAHVVSGVPYNVVVYDYEQAAGTAYLVDIFEGSPSSDPGTTALTDFAHHTHLRWQARPDPTESYRSGWLKQDTRRLAGVDVSSKAYLDSASAARHQVRRYHLSYEGELHQSLLESVQVEGRCVTSSGTAPLSEAAAPAESASGLLPDETSCGRLPPMTFSYSHVEGYQPDGEPDEGGLAGYEPFDGHVLTLPGSPDHSLDEDLTDFFDVNSDGLPDVLVTAPGLYGNDHAVFFGGAAGSLGFGGPTNLGVVGVLGANSNTITLRNQNLAPLDFDGDGHINLLHMPKVATYSAYDPRQVGGVWKWVGREITTASGQSPKVDFGSDTVDTQVVDVDFDGLVDVLVSTGTEYQTFFSLGRHPGGDGQFGKGTRTSATASRLSNEPVTTCVPHSGLPVRLSDGETRLGDMNGDGITDLVKLQRGAIKYWPGRGNGVFGTGERDDCPGGSFGTNRHISMVASPQYSDISSSTVKLGDVNGDGLDDLVQIRFDAVDIWLNVDGQGWTDERHILDGTPYHAGYHNRVRITDVNGSGTSDVVWGDAGAYKYIDLGGGEPAHLLIGVDNGLGKTTEIDYQASTAHMRAAEAKGACTAANDPATHPGTDPWSLGWCDKMPTVTQLVSRVIERDNITIRGRPPAEYVTEYEYRDPYFEGRQREFRGFGRARARRLGDGNSPTDLSESVFLLGECVDPLDGSRWDGVDQDHYCAPPNRWADHPYEALKGLPVETHKLDASGLHLASTENLYSVRTLYEGLDGRAVRHAVLTQTDSLLYDTAAGLQSRVDIARDGYVDLDRAGSVAGPSAPSAYVAGMAHVRSTSAVDRFGNQLSSTNAGCVGGSACAALVTPDEAITQVTKPLLLPHASGWMWRTSESSVQGSVQTALRNQSRTTYDALGRPVLVEALLGGVEALHRNQAVTLPTGGAANGWLVQNSVAYDEFGHAVRTRGANGRCAQLSYAGSAYALFPSSESLFTADTGSVSAASTACVGASLTTSASYDMGLGAVVTALDMNLRPTEAHYDEFGRVRELYKPSASGAGLSPLPSVAIDYQLPGCAGCLAGSLPASSRHSLIHTRTQDGLTEAAAEYLESYAYVDGFGRTLVTLSEADPGAADEAPWIAGSLLEWDQKGAVAKKYLEFFYSGNPAAFDYSGEVSTGYGRQRYDAFGRQVQTYDLDGTITLQSQYHALSTDLWDAADLYVGPHQHTFASELKDGHGRSVRTTERFRRSGVIEARHVETQYLPTGEPLLLRRVRGSDQVVRWMRYDTLGRMVLNVEPNTTTGYTSNPAASSTAIEAWRYQYNAFGDLIGTSDARGCGQNFTYDGAGRILAEDYAPCATHHAPFQAPTGNRDATRHEVTYYYDSSSSLPAGLAPSGWTGGAYTLGRAIAVLDRGSATFSRYDGRGRVVQSQTRVATPTVLNASGQMQNTTLTARYAPRVYSRGFAYDAADREVTATTGAAAILSGSNPAVPQLLSASNQSTVATAYTRRGTVGYSSSSYGILLSDIRRGADGLVHELKYGDAADTRTAYLYDERRRISSVQTYRGPPASGAWGTEHPTSGDADPDEPTRQLTLQDEDFTYDVVGNPVEIRDWRDPSEWPDGAKPVNKKIQYDDLYRAIEVRHEYPGGDDDWVSPFASEVDADANNDDPRRARPSPHVSFTQRILRQTFQYDWLGNSEKTGDDAGGFYDRSLGTVQNDGAAQKPYQVRSATLAAGAGVSSSGSVQVRYDTAGNMTGLGLTRTGACLVAGTPNATACNQRFHYQWDEVGRLSRARRWDGTGAGTSSVDSAVPSTTPAADLRFAYDASDQRILKQAVDAAGVSSFTLYVFDSLELRRTTFSTDYAATSWTVVPYLLAGGVRLARVVYDPDADPTANQSSNEPGFVSQSTAAAGNLFVLFELGDHLGSTSVVLDKGTGELVERATFQAYGGTESDFRPERWKSFREDYRFTGKEEDAEVGLQYFGKRYLNPLLGRWISADPLAVHAPGQADLNLYAYVSGAVLKNVDPLGLDGESQEFKEISKEYNEARHAYTTEAGRMDKQISGLQRGIESLTGSGSTFEMKREAQRVEHEFLKPLQEARAGLEHDWKLVDASYQGAMAAMRRPSTGTCDARCQQFSSQSPEARAQWIYERTIFTFLDNLRRYRQSGDPLLLGALSTVVVPRVLRAQGLSEPEIAARTLSVAADVAEVTAAAAPFVGKARGARPLPGAETLQPGVDHAPAATSKAPTVVPSAPGTRRSSPMDLEPPSAETHIQGAMQERDGIPRARQLMR